MAVIFFEGFNVADSTAVAQNWTLTQSQPNGVTFAQSPARISSAGGGNCSILSYYTTNIGASNEDLSLTNSISTNFGAQTGKKVYIGFGVKNLFGITKDDDATYAADFLTIDSLQFKTSYESGSISLQLWQNSVKLATWLIDRTWYVDRSPVYDLHYNSNWVHLEMEIDLLSSPKKVTLRQNGLVFNTFTSGSAAIIDAGTSISSAVFYGSPGYNISYPLMIDDLYVADSTGTAANTWLGPEAAIYALSLNESSPAVNEWTSRGGGWFGGVLSSDDGDASYYRTGAVNKTQLFSVNTFNPDIDDPAVGGMKMFSRARNVTLPSAYRLIYRDTGNTIRALGSTQQLTQPQYLTNSFFQMVNPGTSQPWTISDINDGKWGMQSVTPS